MPKKNPRKGTAQRGNKAQKDCGDYLERKGYAVHRAVRSKFHGNDVFNAFDLIATKYGEPARYVQVTDSTNPKSSSGVYHRRRKVEQPPIDTKYATLEVWAYYSKDTSENNAPFVNIHRLMDNEGNWKIIVRELYIGTGDPYPKR